MFMVYCVSESILLHECFHYHTIYGTIHSCFHVRWILWYMITSLCDWFSVWLILGILHNWLSVRALVLFMIDSVYDNCSKAGEEESWAITANKLSQIFRDLNGRPFHNHLVKLKLLNINVIKTFLEFSGWRWGKIMTFDKLWASKTEDSSTILFLRYWCALASGLEKKAIEGLIPGRRLGFDQHTKDTMDLKMPGAGELTKDQKSFQRGIW